MERLGGGMKKKGWSGFSKQRTAAAPIKRSPISRKVKFNISVSKDPLPLFQKGASRETKAKTTFLKPTIGAVTKKKPSSPTAKLFAMNSFIRPSKGQTVTNLPKMSTGFNFKTIPSKATEIKKVTEGSLQKKAPLSFASGQPFKFAVNSLVKKSSASASEDETTTGKMPLIRPKVNVFPPITLRGSGQPPVAKKRKASEASVLEGWTGFSSKKRRGETLAVNASFSLTNPQRKGEQDVSKQAAKPKKVVLPLQMNSVLKKRDLSKDQTVKIGSTPKKSRGLEQRPPAQHGNDTTNKAVESRSERTRGIAGADDADAPMLTTLRSDCAVPEATQHVTFVFNTCDDEENEEDLTTKLVCTVNDDKDEKFATRVAAIQEFTDCIAIERKQIHNRLLDAHAEVSEHLLDAITGLLAEEGGIGIDKLNVDMNIDINSGECATALDECII